MRDIDITRIMTTAPVTVSPSDSIERAQALLDDQARHHLPVVEKDRLVGIVSSADLLRCYLLQGGVTSVRAVMVSDPVTLDSRASLREAARELSNGGFHALPVTDTDGALVGIVTSSDLIEHLLRNIPSGDGSLQQDIPDSPSMRSGPAALCEDEVRRAVTEARGVLDRGDDSLSARAMIELSSRLQKMQAVCQAAELYIRTGNAEREHSVLVRKLNDLRELPESVYL